MEMLMKKIIITIFVYLYVFSPPLQLIPISISNILAIGAYSYILTNKSKITSVLYFKRELLILALTFSYLYIIYALTGMKSAEPIFGVFKLLVVDFPIAIALVIYIDKSNFSVYFEKVIIYTFLLAGILSYFLLLNPDVNQYLKTNIIRTLDVGTFKKAMLVRGFGFSDSLLYGYPIALGLGVCFILENIKNRIISVGLSLVLVIPILLNARIGLIPIFFYSIYLLIIKKRFISIVLLAIVIFLIIHYAYNSGLLDEYSFFVDWISGGFSDTISLIQGKEVSGNYSVLSTMIHFPVNILFGAGRYIYIGSDIHSDIGYILQIYYGGFFYLSFIFLFIFTLIYRLIKVLTRTHWFPLISLSVIIVSNIKGNFFSSNPGMHTIILLYVAFIYQYKQSNQRMQ